MRFFATAAAAQLAGFRACQRCRPDATPGSPEWNQRADLVGRAMRLIADGVVDREGVAGLARQLHYSERHLHRQLVAEVGAGPIALARAQRAQTARILIETTDLPISQIAFASGFASIRQFNDTIRAVFAVTPTELRDRAPDRTARRRAGGPDAEATTAGTIALRLPFRAPFDADTLLDFLAARAVAGHRVGRPTAPTVVRCSCRSDPRSSPSRPRPDHVACHAAARRPARPPGRGRALPAPARPRRRSRSRSTPSSTPIPLLEPLVRKHPGLRVPGHVDGFEVLVRAIVGQQVSVAGARTVLGRIVAALG